MGLREKELIGELKRQCARLQDELATAQAQATEANEAAGFKSGQLIEDQQFVDGLRDSSRRPFRGLPHLLLSVPIPGLAEYVKTEVGEVYLCFLATEPEPQPETEPQPEPANDDGQPNAPPPSDARAPQPDHLADLAYDQPPHGAGCTIEAQVATGLAALFACGIDNLRLSSREIRTRLAEIGVHFQCCQRTFTRALKNIAARTSVLEQVRRRWDLKRTPPRRRRAQPR